MNEEQPPTPTLPRDYYRRNVCVLVAHVRETYHDLLTPAALAWADSLLSAGHAAQCLYIRLLLRKGSAFRLNRLNYADIRTVPDAVAELMLCGLLQNRPPEVFQELLGAFTRKELLELLGKGVSCTARRGELEAELLRLDEARRFAIGAREPWVQLCGKTHYQRFCLCYFGNVRQDISEFVLRDLGRLRFEAVSIDQTSRAFHTAAQLQAHWDYFQCEAQASTLDKNDAMAIGELARRLPVAEVDDAHLSRRVDRLRTQLARQLERLGALAEALALYDACHRPPANERAVRVLMALARWSQAEARCRALLENPINDEERHVGRVLLRRIANACGKPPPFRRHWRPSTSILTLTQGSGRVEAQACHFYNRRGKAHHTESALVNAVLGLFIWDILFAPVRGAFFNPFQSGPVDLYEPDFVLRRRSLLLERWQELDDPTCFARRVQEQYRASAGMVNPLVSWSRVPLSLLDQALQCIPCDHWKAMFDRLLADLRSYRSGLPDLVVFDHQGGYEFIEIKGPGDALQRNQRDWLAYLAEKRIPARVVRLRWARLGITSA